MGFWDTFTEVWEWCWAFMDTPMTIGGFYFSFADVLITGGIAAIAGKIIQDVIYGEG